MGNKQGKHYAAVDKGAGPAEEDTIDNAQNHVGFCVISFFEHGAKLLKGVMKSRKRLTLDIQGHIFARHVVNVCEKRKSISPA